MIGNKNADNFKLACCYCGGGTDLTQVAHRDSLGRVIGYVFLCNGCFPVVTDNYEVVIKEV